MLLGRQLVEAAVRRRRRGTCTHVRDRQAAARHGHEIVRQKPSANLLIHDVRLHSSRAPGAQASNKPNRTRSCRHDALPAAAAKRSLLDRSWREEVGPMPARRHQALRCGGLGRGRSSPPAMPRSRLARRRQRRGADPARRARGIWRSIQHRVEALLRRRALQGLLAVAGEHHLRRQAPFERAAIAPPAGWRGLSSTSTHCARDRPRIGAGARRRRRSHAMRCRAGAARARFTAAEHARRHRSAGTAAPARAARLRASVPRPTNNAALAARGQPPARSAGVDSSRRASHSSTRDVPAGMPAFGSGSASKLLQRPPWRRTRSATSSRRLRLALATCTSTCSSGCGGGRGDAVDQQQQQHERSNPGRAGSAPR